jgi:hypothetical protein
MYIKRNLEDNIIENLERKEIIVIVGPRQSGKTELLRKIKNLLEEKGESTFFINLENRIYLQKLDEHPENLFDIIGNIREKRIFIIIDEVQYLENPSNFLKYVFDEYNEKIKLIVSGSSAFYIDQKFKDSLAGRKRLFELKLLGFREFLSFKGLDDLKFLFDKDGFPEKRNIPLIYINTIENLFKEFIKYGSYPGVVLEKSEKDKLFLLEELFNSYLAKDIEIEGVKKSGKFYSLLKILAMQTGELVNNLELSNTLGISTTAVENYLYILEKSFIIKRIRPFYNNMRKEISKMPKLYFLDMGIRNIILNNFEAIHQRIDMGHYFENIIFKLLYDNGKGINYWRTQAKNEVDFIIDGKSAIEVKYNGKSFKENKYKYFKENYEKIKLSVVSYENIREFSVYDLI